MKEILMHEEVRDLLVALKYQIEDAQCGNRISKITHKHREFALCLDPYRSIF